jgi:uncharacterized protein YjiS (DUF1127 family)
MNTIAPRKFMTPALHNLSVSELPQQPVLKGTSTLKMAPAASKRGLALWLHRLQMRRELAQLDSRQLDDCGLDPDALRREVLKPFWRA